MNSRKFSIFAVTVLVVCLMTPPVMAQDDYDEEPAGPKSLFDNPARWLVNMPTAGTLARGHYEIGVHMFNNGGGIGHTDIGLSNRLQLGISFGGEGIISTADPKWYPTIAFNVKFRIVDEEQYFPAIAAGFSSQGFGSYSDEQKRYTFKSRGFYGVVSRSFYFYEWTAGWHAGINYSLENEVDKQDDPNFFVGFDATFKYNLALLFEWDAAINDDASSAPEGQTENLSGRGRGYLNTGLRWLYNDNLELEFRLTDLLGNRREFETVGRELRITYIGSF